MKNIQITTDRETAESCGYALMGARNMLSSRIETMENSKLRDRLNSDRSIISAIITAFAHADIVDPQGSPSGDDNNQDAKSYVSDHHRPVAVGQASNKPLSEASIPLHVVEFVGPNGKQVDRVLGVDPALANAAHDIANHCAWKENRGRFTFENCGAFWNLCFECLVPCEDEDGEEMQDVVSEIVTITPDKPDIAPSDWTPVIERAAKHLGLVK